MTHSSSPAFEIDHEICSGHGRCYALAPQWFEADDAGYGRPVGTVEVGTPQADLDFIVDSCPEQAISIVSANTHVGAGGPSKEAQ